MGNSHKISLGGGLAVVVHVTWMKIRLGFCGFVWLSIVGQWLVTEQRSCV